MTVHERMLNSLSLGIVLSTKDGRILEANQSAQEMLGYTLEELRGIHARDLWLYPEQRPAIMREVLSSCEAVLKQIELVGHDGVAFCFEVSMKHFGNGEHDAVMSQLKFAGEE
jgi:PAS domain S-box-containing protein